MSWITWPFRMIGFVLWFAGQVVIANVAVIRDNLTPGQDSTPGVAMFTTMCRTDVELTALAALITLTPGTLTLGTSARAHPGAARVLYVHGMYHPDAQSLRAEITTMEGRMLSAIRRQGES